MSGRKRNVRNCVCCKWSVNTEDVSAIHVDSKENLKEVEKFTTKYLPTLKGKASLYAEETPLFERYGVDLEMERALSNKVYLRSGGSLNIDQILIMKRFYNISSNMKPLMIC